MLSPSTWSGIGLCLASVGLLAGCSRSSDVRLPSWFSSDGPIATSEQIKQQIATVEARLRSFERTKCEVEALREDCVRQKTDLVSRLKKAGVTSSADLQTKPINQQSANQLLNLVREIESYQHDAGRLAVAIEEARMVCRRLQRAQSFNEAGISAETIGDMTSIMLRLEAQDQRGTSLVPDAVRLDEILRAEVYGNSTNTK